MQSINAVNVLSYPFALGVRPVKWLRRAGSGQTMKLELSEAGYKPHPPSIDSLFQKVNICHSTCSLRVMSPGLDRSRLEYQAEIALRLRKIVNDLNEESVNGALVVVEGKRDFMALRSFGFIGKSFMIAQGGLPQFLKVAESYHKVILLLDYDKKGRYMFARALKLLHSKGISADSRFRIAVMKATCGEVKHIEDLERYAYL
jgi:5S rRNA maturation endonuclease (ribonuclease M5)